MRSVRTRLSWRPRHVVLIGQMTGTDSPGIGHITFIGRGMPGGVSPKIPPHLHEHRESGRWFANPASLIVRPSSNDTSIRDEWVRYLVVSYRMAGFTRLYRAKFSRSHRLDHCLTTDKPSLTRTIEKVVCRRPIRFTAKLELGAPDTRLRSTSAGQSLAVSCSSASSIARLSTTPSAPFSGISTSAAII
jgi:hypothetical protein